MPHLNPDFRGVDEIVVPRNKKWGGYTPGTDTEKEAREIEKRAFAKLENDIPVKFKTRIPKVVDQRMMNAFDDFQQSKGRQPGSHDWSLLDEWIHNEVLIWKPQIIGSCVCSNTFRAYVIRQMYQITMLGETQEYLGRSQFGPNNYAFYCPYTYGAARKRANMRGGDGLYCAPMVETLMKDGVVSCTTPKLQELCQRLGVDRDTDYPEPQNSGVYRAFGDWRYLDQLKPYADYEVMECPTVTSAQQLWDLQLQGKPTFVCSMEAIHKVGTHRDGFPIHARNPRDQWAHNMAVHGCFTGSDGERFFRWSNESWGAHHIYNRRFGEVQDSFSRGRLTMAAIGEIHGPSSSPPLWD